MLSRTLFPRLRALAPAIRTLTTFTPPASAATHTINTSPRPAPPQPATPPSPSLSTLLPLLRAQQNHYITIHIHGFPFLVTAGDTVTLPFRLKGVAVGQTLRLTHASVLGSRDYTLKGAPFIDEALYSCRATVVEETSEPMRIKTKTKRRNRKIKTVKSKHPYTVLRIKELVVKGEEDLLA